MPKNELELYVHIPFCVRKCNYCDFLSAPSDEKTRELYVQALCREIASYQGMTGGYEVGTVFFGGGTPSLLRAEQFNRIVRVLRETFCFRDISVMNADGTYETEFTVECNPGTLTKELLSSFQQLGVNRLSIGLQSADDAELKLLGRIHSYKEFLESFRLARAAGFENINVDLMQALPGQTMQSFQDTLQKVIALGPEHISAYSLIIEENTRFYEWYGENPDKLPSEDTERDIYKMTQSMLKDAGYIQYEISNFAKPGYECRHNCGYWTGTEYLGLGLGASSYMNGCRFEQVDNLTEYLANYADSADCRTRHKNHHELSTEEKMEEFMFLGLRLCSGIRKTEFKKRFKTDYEGVYGNVTRNLVQQGLLKEEGEFISLTELGCDLSNRVLAEFLFDS